MPAKKQERNRGQIIPKSDGRWLVRFFAGRGPDGKRKYPAKLVEGTFKQAEKELTKMLRESDTGTFVAPSKVTLEAHLKDWLKGKLNLSAKTAREYKARMDKDVVPVLGAVALAKVTTKNIQSLIVSLKDRGLSPRTIEYTYTILSQSLESAVRADLLVKNPAKYVELPKKDDKEPVVFSHAQASLFLEKASRSQWYPLWATLLSAGLRPQEAGALEWSHVDLPRAIIRITQALVEVKPGIYEIGPVKTKRGNRAISIPSEIVEILKAHKKATHTLGGYVFPNAAGHHYDLSRVRKAWYKEIEQVNVVLVKEQLPPLPRPKLYGARHSHHTIALEANIHPKAVAQRGGHSEAVAMEVYSHVLSEVDVDAGKKIGVLLFPKVAQG